MVEDVSQDALSSSHPPGDNHVYNVGRDSHLPLWLLVGSLIAWGPVFLLSGPPLPPLPFTDPADKRGRKGEYIACY